MSGTEQNKSFGEVKEMTEIPRADNRIPEYTIHYESPIGGILLAADAIGLTGLWFDGGKYYAAGLSGECEEKSVPVLENAKEWLDIYFSGREPDFLPPLHLKGSSFQTEVWDILRQIPYGKTTTYGEIAGILAKKRGLARMSAQAVGGAVGHNPVSVIVPCHRVVGSDGSLTGYAGGIDKKRKLLEYEGADMSVCYIPRRGTAL